MNTVLLYKKPSITRLAWSLKVHNFCWTDFVWKLTTFTEEQAIVNFILKCLFLQSPEADLEEGLLLWAPVPSSPEATLENSPKTHKLAAVVAGGHCEVGVCYVQLIVQVPGPFVSTCLKYPFGKHTENLHRNFFWGIAKKVCFSLCNSKLLSEVFLGHSLNFSEDILLKMHLPWQSHRC